MSHGRQKLTIFLEVAKSCQKFQRPKEPTCWWYTQWTNY